MSLAKAKKYLEEKGYVDHIIELEDSSREFDTLKFKKA